VYVGDNGLYTLTQGSAQRILTAPPGSVREPRWSPDGTRVAFAGQDRNLWVVGADGSGAHPLTSQAVPPSGCGDDSCTNSGTSIDTPRWSPDGRSLSYRLVEGWSQASIWVISAAGSQPRMIASASDICMFNEGFAPDGTPLYSRCAASAGPSNATYLSRKDGSEKSFLAGSQVAFSGDGSHVAFSSQAAGKDGIMVTVYTAASDGSGAMAVAHDGQNPAWSRDGKLAYQVSGAGGWQIHVYSPAAGDVVVASGQLGGWTPDGGWLYFTQVDDSGSSIWIVAADGSAATRLASGEMPNWAS
jgi:Tol biopolymer transport system component